MSIQVEFYGVARLRSGAASVSIDVMDDAIPFGDLLRRVAEHCPQLVGECIEGDRLQDAYVANLDGDMFLQDSTALVRDGQSLLILSADAGG